jgi:hypothetical protein
MTDRRPELFSEKIAAGSRTYFFDIKESADKTKYLVISESRQRDGKAYEHSRVMVFEEHLPAFCDGLGKAFQFLIGSQKKAGSHAFQELRRDYPQAYSKWTEAEDVRLRNEFRLGKKLQELADSFQRQPGAIRARLQKLGLLDLR